MKSAHLSIDDVEGAFIDLISNSEKCESIYQVPLFRFLKDLNERFSAKFTLYCYSAPRKYSLSDVPSKFRRQFYHASDWLKFGFHWSGKDYNPHCPEDKILEDCQSFYRQIARFAGANSIAQTIRLHHYHPSIDLCSKISDLKWFDNEVTFFCADSYDRRSYDLSSDQNIIMHKCRRLKIGKRLYIPTDLRLEHKNDIRSVLHRLDNATSGIALGNDALSVVIFTHEWAISGIRLKENLRRIIGKSDLPTSWFLKYKLRSVAKTLFQEGFHFVN